MVNRALKSIMYLTIAGMLLYFLGGVNPRIIGLLEGDNIIKTFLIAVYWISVLVIIGVPQYITWFTEDDVELISPIKSMAAFAVSFLAIVVVTIAVTKLLNVMTLSNTSNMIFNIIFWLFVVLTFFVPQVFVFESLKGMLGVDG